MIFFSIGLPGPFAEWCDALLLRLVEHQFAHAQSAAFNSLEEFAQAAIKSRSLCLVACCRQPVGRLQNEIINSGVPFLIALSDPRAALRDLIDRSGLSLVDATRAAASSCTAMLGIAKSPNALVLKPGSLDHPLVTAAAIAGPTASGDTRSSPVCRRSVGPSGHLSSRPARSTRPPSRGGPSR